MPVNGDSSIVPDSTASSSPIMTPGIKRASRTYGRARPTAEPPEDSDLSFASNTTMSTSQSSIYKTALSFSQEEVPPSSQGELSFSSVNQVEDEDANENDARELFSFSWRQKLKDIDEQDDFDFMSPKTARRLDASPSHPLSCQPHMSLQREDEGRTSDHSNISDREHLDESKKALTPPSNNMSDAEDSPIRRTIKRRHIQRVDSEGEGEPPKSTPQSEDPSFAFTPPAKNQHSPTPPTSDEDEDMPTRVMPGHTGKNKGKGRAQEGPDVLHLELTQEMDKLASPVRGKKSRVKPPTKKDIVETAKARSRLAAEKNATIPRDNVSSQKYTLINLLADVAEDGLREQTLHSSQPSEPDTIRDFSSDAIQPSPQIETWQSIADMGSSSTRPIRKIRVTSPSPMSKKQDLNGLDRVSDEELPDIQTLSKQTVKPDPSALAEMKRRLLAEQLKARRVGGESDDDDLAIVDTMDPQTAFKAEESERKAGRGKPVPEGKKRYIHFATQSKKVQGARFSLDGRRSAKPADGFQDRNTLNQVLFRNIQEANQKAIQEKEARWSELGGTLKRNLKSNAQSAQEVAKQYAAEALKNARQQGDSMMESSHSDDEDEEGSDPDWEEAEIDRGSATPSPIKTRELEPDDAMDNVDASTPLATNEEEEGMSPTHAKSRRCPKAQAILDSDDDADEENQIPRPAQNLSSSHLLASPLPPPAVMAHRGSLSSLDERTEDDGDKENDTSQIWDRSEDKENKAVVRHLTSPRPTFGERKQTVNRLGSLAGPWSPGISPTARSEKGEDRRKPFQDLLEGDVFSSQAGPSQPSSFLAKLHQSSPTARGRPFSEEDGPNLAGPSKTVSLEPSFSDLFESGTAKQPVKSFLKSPGGPLSGLAAAFSDDEDSTAFRASGMSTELALTQDVAFGPAFQIGTQSQRRADQIFEKEQGYLIEAAAAQKLRKEPTLYVDEVGFLTQTKPTTSSPEIYRQRTLTQQMSLSQPSTSPRKPLRTLSFVGSTPSHSDSPAPLTRLRKRSKSPTSPPAERIGISRSVTAFERPPKNAFDALKEGAVRERSEHERRWLEKSEFVENEAQESDDDDMVGFGFAKPKDNDDEEGDEDNDQHLPSLMDDHKMDDNEENVEKVLQKYQEQADKDDAELEKYHQKAIQGEFRKKRRGHGLGLDDSDESGDEDDAERLRRKMHKRPRIERQVISELEKQEETKAFFNVYQQDLEKEEQEFAYLGESQPLDVDMADDNHDAGAEEDGEDEENMRPKEKETVSTHQIHRELQERAQLMKDSAEFNAQNLEWMDEDEEEDELVIKTVAGPLQEKPRGAEDGEPSMPAPRSTLMSERSVMWAKQEGRSRTAGTTGRSVGGAAVTGHTKTKSGGGSVRGVRTAANASSTNGRAEQQRRPVRAQSSVLSTVAAERSTKFK